ncbi:MAG: sulfotransferase family protein [Gaiellaceae bacterium]
MQTEHIHVFIGGVHRSGTTLLGRLLGEHPEASGFADTGVPADEGQHLQSVFPPARAYGGPGRFAFADEAALTETSALVAGAHDRLMADWAPHWDLSRRVLIEKSPPNLLRFRFLQAVFPGAHLVAMLRHPLAVAYATQKWSKTSIPSLLEHWLIAYERFRRDTPLLKHVLEVRYEDLVADANATVGSLETAIGLSPRAASDSIEPGSNARYFARWRAESGRALTGLRHRRAARRLEDRANAFGYSLSEPG